ncbi:low molecular weight protein-tyrosine-phosphatase [Rhizorhapis suberifaciens]|uniref:protein-tyrosine-phosphatase n=1 Tax=Rhizorhapis suberifaciens TaxID=13656 RepID=A0A840HVF2_9SPHN|nr:low molecular weight protein-tyrosine-phosphatase [Rhizorhapis suberifaciens]MBB4641587.1 protein-tyrosine phosphatase [Rhizorhapis suberifaciens]
MDANILFVCLGNICRSPLAEAALRQAAEAHGLDIGVDSAGTGDWHVGQPPDHRAQAVARQNGADIAGYRGRQVKLSDFLEFTHIVAMDSENMANLQSIKPSDATARLSLLLDHVIGREGDSVADPYFGGEEGFRATWADVTAGVEALLKTIEDERRR